MVKIMLISIIATLRSSPSTARTFSCLVSSRHRLAFFSPGLKRVKGTCTSQKLQRQLFAQRRERSSQEQKETDTSVPAILPFASEYHTPVMVKEVVETLVHDPTGVYIDGTLGGGGHSEAILGRLASLGGAGQLLAVDRDPEALASARTRLAAHLEAGRFATAQSDFRHLKTVLGPGGALSSRMPADGLGVHGLLLDLGVSSHQLDESSRGFSHQSDGPLDMRMESDEKVVGESSPAATCDGEGAIVSSEIADLGHRRRRGPGLTAAVVVNEWPVEELRRVLQDYGEEPRAHKMALRLSEARPLNTTAQVADVVRSCLPPGPPKDKRKALSRVFQGLRIAVNDEMGALEAVLMDATRFVRPGGRIVVLSYHSLEDRRVKRVLRSGGLDGKVEQDMFGNVLSPWRPLRKVPKAPSSKEVAMNSRARSAKLRASERTDYPPPSLPR
mmetsp:Transcript_46293/g.93444  ORF Transcript_46293/g.93444 Transcript_46293/m.93444 type:complete len:444 (+) Transcript_46293:78-1409(+)